MVETGNLGQVLKKEDQDKNGFDYEDIEILCVDCESSFIWTAGEQTFFRDKGLENPPKRCKICKQQKNTRLSSIQTAQFTDRKKRVEVAVHCARCEARTTVPFYPSQGRPVFCRSCFIELNPSLLTNTGA